MKLNKFVAVDWSGAEGPGLKGLKVASCEPGTRAPTLVTSNGNWRRSDLVNWITYEAIINGAILVGFDFAFTFPYCDYEAYFPDSSRSPDSVQFLWEEVESICSGSREFYGGPFFKSTTAPFAEYLCYMDYTGAKYRGDRYRVTESVCTDKFDTRPTTVFKCVGPDSVGIGSVAGMRLLNYFCHRGSISLAIWPFQRIQHAQSVFVEIFPRLYYVQANQDPTKWNKLAVINDVLSHFNSEPLPDNFEIKSEDEADALVSAAALRHLSYSYDTWQPPSMNNCARMYEGWIFGV